MDPVLLNLILSIGSLIVGYLMRHNGIPVPGLPTATPAAPVVPAPVAPAPAASATILQEVLAVLTSVILPKLQSALSQPAAAALPVTHEIPMTARLVVTQTADAAK